MSEPFYVSTTSAHGANYYKAQNEVFGELQDV